MGKPLNGPIPGISETIREPGWRCQDVAGFGGNGERLWPGSRADPAPGSLEMVSIQTMLSCYTSEHG